MATPIVTSATQVMCGHAGTGSHIATQVRVKVAGSPVAVASDQYTVAGCSLASSGAPTICTVLAWTMPAIRVKAGGVPVLINTSMPQGVGPGVVIPGQVRVSAT